MLTTTQDSGSGGCECNDDRSNDGGANLSAATGRTGVSVEVLSVEAHALAAEGANRCIREPGLMGAAGVHTERLLWPT
jgi:hypothetical protein